MLDLHSIMQASLSRVGIDPSAALARARSQSRGRKRVRSEGPDVEMGDAEQQKRLHSSKSRCLSRLVKASNYMLLLLLMCECTAWWQTANYFLCLGHLFTIESCNGAVLMLLIVPCRSMSRGRALSTQAGKGLKDASQQNKAIKIGDKATFKRGKMARKGEADRHIPTLRPKHLLSGKRGNGKTDRR